MRYLVTGGAGFIGSHIARALLAAGHSVRVLDNLYAGSTDRLLGIMDKIEFIKADIRDLDALESATNGCNGVFHEAALVSVQQSFDMRDEYQDVNVNGTKNVLDVAKRQGARVVYASSASVYGDAKRMPMREEDASRTPINPYGATKAEAEIISQKYMTGGAEGVVGLRYFNVYGVGQTSAYAGVITQFMRRLEEGRPPVINGDGSQSRDFVYVEDVASANLAAMASYTRDGFFNIGTGRSITINELAQVMIQAYDVDVVPEHADPLEGDVRESRADTSLTARFIPWTYSTELKDGIACLVGSPLAGGRAFEHCP